MTSWTDTTIPVKVETRIVKGMDEKQARVLCGTTAGYGQHIAKGKFRVIAAYAYAMDEDTCKLLYWEELEQIYE